MSFLSAGLVFIQCRILLRFSPKLFRFNRIFVTNFKKTNKDFFWNIMLGTFGEMNILIFKNLPGNVLVTDKSYVYCVTF